MKFLFRVRAYSSCVVAMLAALWGTDVAAERASDLHVLRQAMAKVVAPGEILHNPDATGSGAEYDEFGSALVLDGDTAFVGSIGAYSPDAPGTRGAVIVMQRSAGAWTEVDRLIPDAAAASESFGHAIASDGSTVVVGAPTAASTVGPNRGVVYVFVRTQGAWVRQARLEGDYGESGDAFGSAVAIDGDVVLVGTPAMRVAGVASGAAIEFRRVGDTWTQTATLTSTESESDERFGTSVVLDGTLAAVGASRRRDAGGQQPGGVFVYEYDGTQWQPTQHLTGPGKTGSIGDRLSWNGETLLASERRQEGFVSYSLNGTGFETGVFYPKPPAVQSFCHARIAHTATVALIGCAGDTQGGIGAGSALIYDRSGTTWVLRQRLRATSPSSRAAFGHAVALSGDAALIGAPNAFASAGTDAGIVEAYAVDSAGAFGAASLIDGGSGPANDFFGSRVAFDGDTAVVGAELDNTPAGADAGAVHVFVRDGTGWALQATLRAAAGSRGFWFGSAVAIEDDTLVVGERAASGYAGAVHVFRRQDAVWTLQQRLTTSSATSYPMFGSAVAVQGNRLVVGAPALTATGIGRAYVFEHLDDHWQQVAMLRAADETAASFFGGSVAIDGDTVLVGAPAADRSGLTDAGTAYVFQHDAGLWLQRAMLIATDAAPGDRFGESVSLRGAEALVGATSAGPAGTRSGAAYLFRRDSGTWTQRQRFDVPTAADGAHVGSDVALGAQLLAIGATRSVYSETTPPGAVHLFGRGVDGFVPLATLQPSSSQARDGYGTALALDGHSLLAGTPGLATADGVFPRAGAAWLHRLPVRVTIDNGGAINDAVHWLEHGSSGSFDLAAPEGRQLTGATGCGGTLQGTVFITASLMDDCTVTVSFSTVVHTVVYLAGAHGTLVGDTSQTVAHGSNGTPVEAVAAAHHRFAGWSDGTQDNPRTEHDVRDSATFTASFANSAPRIDALTHTPTQVYERGNMTIHLAAADDESAELAYRFDCDGDGDYDTGPQPSPQHTCATAAPGAQTVVVEVSDGAGAAVAASLVVTVLDARPVVGVSLSADAAEDQPILLAVTAQSPSSGDVITRVEVDCDHDGDFMADLEAAQAGAFDCPAPAHGGTRTVAARAFDDEGDVSDIAILVVAVADINDAPALTLAALPSFPAGSVGGRIIAGFATFDAGPDDEDASQHVDDYLLDIVDDPSLVLDASGVDIHDDGALLLTLTGRSGTARLLVRVRDSGPAGGPHANTSASVEFEVSVAPGADLQTGIDNGVTRVLDGDEVMYRVVVANAGPSDAAAVRIATMAAPALRDLAWQCRADLSTAPCPVIGAGTGALHSAVTLPADAFLRFDVAARIAADGAASVSMSATATLLDDIALLQPNDDSATDVDLVMPDGILVDGFEAAVPALSVPAANAVLHAQQPR